MDLTSTSMCYRHSWTWLGTPIPLLVLVKWSISWRIFLGSSFVDPRMCIQWTPNKLMWSRGFCFRCWAGNHHTPLRVILQPTMQTTADLARTWLGNSLAPTAWRTVAGVYWVYIYIYLCVFMSRVIYSFVQLIYIYNYIFIFIYSICIE